MGSVAKLFDGAVSVDAPFNFEREFQLRSAGRYCLYLTFDRRDAPVERLRQLVGGAYGQTIEIDGKHVDIGEPPGVPVPLDWELRGRNTVILRSQAVALGAQLWSEAEVRRLLFCSDLTAGDYKLEVELSEGVPEFRGIRTRLRMEELK